MHHLSSSFSNPTFAIIQRRPSYNQSLGEWILNCLLLANIFDSQILFSSSLIVKYVGQIQNGFSSSHPPGLFLCSSSSMCPEPEQHGGDDPPAGFCTSFRCNSYSICDHRNLTKWTGLSGIFTGRQHLLRGCCCRCMSIILSVVEALFALAPSRLPKLFKLLITIDSRLPPTLRPSLLQQLHQPHTPVSQPQ